MNCIRTWGVRGNNIVCGGYARTQTNSIKINNARLGQTCPSVRRKSISSGVQQYNYGYYHGETRETKVYHDIIILCK